MPTFLNLHVDGEKEQLECKGIPFEIFRRDKRAQPMSCSGCVAVDAEAEYLFFLGMTTQAPAGECGWIGERYHAYQRKLFIGDMLGRIDILYERNRLDAIPLIFGVNVWSYEAFSPGKAYEGPVFEVNEPYREPFDSDRAARRLLDDSLQLCETDGDKYTKYIFAFKPRKNKIAHITVKPSNGRDSGVGISAVTAFGSQENIPLLNEQKICDSLFFMQKRYYEGMDKLSRRLYQFLDEIPPVIRIDKPAAYRGPEVFFDGSPEAAILTNVYYHNLCDMMSNKVEENGYLHTSTRDAPCFGFYNGIGTFKDRGHYNYYHEIWSRDIGRLLCELIEHGERERVRAAADVLLTYLYDKGILYDMPNWKRIANSSELDYFPDTNPHTTMDECCKGKENDGHASVMIFFYRLYRHGVVDKNWLLDRFVNLKDAAEWFCWQMDNPGLSDFDRVLSSESESSYGSFGGYDMFSNSYAYCALDLFAELAFDIGKREYGIRWRDYAKKLETGIKSVFMTDHPRYGRVICEPESDNWPSEMKRIAGLLLMPEIRGYDPDVIAPEMAEIWKSTYKAQKESFFSTMAGGSMGYGMGYNTQAALLLDQIEDYSGCLDWTARFCYHHTDYPYIVPEGVTYHPSGRFWYRHTDLGNAVQQTEIVKCLRLVLGLDDLCPEEGLRLIPRIPDGWERIETKGYPIAVSTGDGTDSVSADYRYERIPGGYRLSFSGDRPTKLAYLRIGPFDPGTEEVRAEGISEKAILRQRGTRVFAYIDVNTVVSDCCVLVKAEKPAEAPLPL